MCHLNGKNQWKWGWGWGYNTMHTLALNWLSPPCKIKKQELQNAPKLFLIVSNGFQDHHQHFMPVRTLQDIANENAQQDNLSFH